MSYRTSDAPVERRRAFTARLGDWWDAHGSHVAAVFVAIIAASSIVGLGVALRACTAERDAAREAAFCGPCSELCTAQGGRTLTCIEHYYESRCVCLTRENETRGFGWDFTATGDR